MAKRSLMAKGLTASTPMTGDMHEGPPLVAFDFDGTLTVRDSFTAFLKWRASPARHALGMIRLFPAATAYVFDRNRGKIKAAAVREFLRGVSLEQLEREARAFAQSQAPRLFRPDALAVWRRWRAKGAKLVIVTASPDVIVAPFARGLGADVLIGSRLALDLNDRINGALLGPNCRGPEKVIRLREQFGDDMSLAAAYGDTSGDHEMLAIAHEKGYRIFRGKPG
ncbi:haloacid dehalogenase superfamily protein, subfamily IB, phosphoserine phosphatase [Caulobacter sp. AP07]|uniref:HAD-IB family hydrolase n=1 Tax=Caulobacter sp. AP07 TaxID=1144304 RepID=UPI000271DA93|nr:HAD-IB family hydrolase [Caulobacter sp. AP07]EJL21064.1 haloacid dehalogenase superfamily protein, subfamily IB, phosphoserine phosphatase [Caulobacter sp. AP07]